MIAEEVKVRVENSQEVIDNGGHCVRQYILFGLRVFTHKSCTS